MPASPTRNRIHAARRRSAAALLSAALGILASWELPGVAFGPTVLFLCSALLAVLALLIPRRLKRAGPLASGTLLCAAIFTFAFGWGGFRLHTPAAPELLTRTAHSTDLITLRLTVLENPRAKSASEPDAKHDSWHCLARARSIVDDAGSTPLGADVWLSVRSSSSNQRLPRPGDRLIARGTFRAVGPPANPGEFNLERWARDRSIAGSFFVPASTLIRPDESPPGIIDSAVNTFRRSVGALRARASDTVDALSADASPDGRQFLRGLLLGENPPSHSQGLSSFYELGLAHILSISGFHLAVFAGATLLVLRLCGDLGRLEPLLMAGAIGLFLVIVPASSPLVRAASIILVLLLAESFERRYDRLALLAWLALIILLVRPSELWSLGFQLSFGLTAALLGIAQRFSLRLFPTPLGIRPRTHWLWDRVRTALVALYSTGLLCWALSAPWIASSVGIFNPLAVLTTILLTPVIVLVLWLGYAAMLAGLLVPPIASGASPIASALTDFAIALARWWDSLPIATLRVPPLSTAWAICASTLLAFWFARTRLRLPGFALAAVALLIWAGVEAHYAHRLPASVAARIHLLDVPGASCAIVRTHEGDWMVLGTKPESHGRTIVQTARSLGVWRVHTLVLTGPGEPAPDIVRALRPGRITTQGSQSELPRVLPEGLPRRPSDWTGGMGTVDVSRQPE